MSQGAEGTEGMGDEVILFLPPSDFPLLPPSLSLQICPAISKGYSWEGVGVGGGGEGCREYHSLPPAQPGAWAEPLGVPDERQRSSGGL